MIKRYNLVSIIFLLVGTVITYFSYYEFNLLDRERITNLFEKEVNKISTSFDLELENYLEGLFVVQDLLTEFDPPYSSFKKVMKEMIKRHQGIRYAAWIPRIKRKERALFEKKAAKQIKNFRIKNISSTDNIRKYNDFYPFYYIYPTITHKQLIGLNLYPNDPVFNQLVHIKDDVSFKAFKNLPSLKKRLLDSQYIFFIPVYYTDRKVNIKGYLATIIDLSQVFITAIQNNETSDINIIISDFNENGDRTILYRSRGFNQHTNRENSYYIEKEILNFEGHKCVISAYPSEEYLSSVRNFSPYFILFANLIVTIIVVFLIRRIMIRTLLIEKQKDELAFANHQLEILSNTDALTGLANRRHFEEFLEHEWKRSLRESTPITLIMIDIDHFKKYNDTYGHLAGDKCLRLVAQTLAKVISRPADLVSRYGGEEFAIILSNTEDTDGKVAAKCVKEVNLLNIPHKSSPVTNHVTISAGSATYAIAPPDLPPKSIILKADKALYAAKEEGRNRVKVLY